MGKLIYAANISLDGFLEDETGSFDWSVPDEDVHEFWNEHERHIGTSLYGRRMYETMRVWESDDWLTNEPPVVHEYAGIWRDADNVPLTIPCCSGELTPRPCLRAGPGLPWSEVVLAAAYRTAHAAEDRQDRSDYQHDHSNGREHGEALDEQSDDQKHDSENDHLGFLSLRPGWPFHSNAGGPIPTFAVLTRHRIPNTVARRDQHFGCLRAAMLAALIAGQEDAQVMAEMARGRMRPKIPASQNQGMFATVLKMSLSPEPTAPTAKMSSCRFPQRRRRTERRPACPGWRKTSGVPSSTIWRSPFNRASMKI